MAVYERTYKRYAGTTTPQWARFLVLPRYVVKDVFKSKFFLVFFIVSFIYPLLCGGAIYLRHNADLLEILRKEPLEPRRLRPRNRS